MTRIRVMPATRLRGGCPIRRAHWHPGVVPPAVDQLPWLARRHWDLLVSPVSEHPTHVPVAGPVPYVGTSSVALMVRSILSAGAWRGGY